ncbi:MAG: hypothetical protein AB7R40_26430 [Nitrospiraceae bacterium]
MSIRRKFERKIREKESEIQELEKRLMEARAYVSAMQDAMRLVPADGDADGGENGGEVVIKAGSAMEAVRKALTEAGKPMHIMDLLKAIGKEATPENRASVGGSLAAYVRKGVVFSRPAPNTFGLAEWGRPSGTAFAPPDDFGVPGIDNA